MQLAPVPCSLLLDLKKSFVTLLEDSRAGPLVPVKLKRNQGLGLYPSSVQPILRLFVPSSDDPQDVSTPQAELTTEDTNLLAAVHFPIGHCAFNLGPIFICLIGVESVAFPFFNLHSLFGLPLGSTGSNTLKE